MSQRKRTSRKKNSQSTHSNGAPQSQVHRSKKQRHQKHSKKRSYQNNSHSTSGEGTITLNGTVDKKRQNLAFIIFDRPEFEDAFVPPRWAVKLFHGDRVSLTLEDTGQVLNLKILSHRYKTIVGRFIPHPTKSKLGWVLFTRKKYNEEIQCLPCEKPIPSGHWVFAELFFGEDNQSTPQAKILQVFGETFPPSIDLSMIAGEFNLDEHHSDQAKSFAKKLSLNLEKELPKRKDLRTMNFITIDGETARDFDDAVFVEKENSNYSLWVAIADVSHYVEEKNPLDQEAYARGTSVYFPERAFHMLPSELSEGLCSLKPHEPRLTLTVKIDFNNSGKILDIKIFNSIIESKRRTTYNEIQLEKEQNENNPAWEYHPHFELYKILKSKRKARGSIDFDFPEASIKVNEEGEPIDISTYPRKDSHRLIEEFMIVANEAVTQWMMKKNWPFIFRIHEEPSPDALEKFSKLTAHMGIPLLLRDEPVPPRVLSDFLEKISGHQAEPILSYALLRSMKQAVYTADHQMHYGLASKGYTHFTSPIRRYPDLVVHRLIKSALANENIQPDKLQAQLVEISAHCSYRERLATDAEREMIRLKQVRFAHNFLGQILDGKITGMHDAGFYVQILKPFIEGFVPKETLRDDFFEFNAEKMFLLGSRTKIKYKIGDPVTIQVVAASIEMRQVEFQLSDSAVS